MKRFSVFFLLLLGLVFLPAYCKDSGYSHLRPFSNGDGMATAAPLESGAEKKGSAPIQGDFAAQKKEGLRTMFNKATVLKKQGGYAHVRTGDSILTVVNHPVFKGFCRYILPSDNDLLDSSGFIHGVV